MFALDAERAHDLGIKAIQIGMASPFYVKETDFELGPVECFGLKFRNPIGLAAGFDKNGLVFNQLASLGFGFVEVGTVTLRPQKGNEKPRLFRLQRDKALINRMGFNNDGAEVVSHRLRNTVRNCIVGVNIGRNKDVPNEEAVENYVSCFEILQPVADYVAVNISSPNTPGLRELQKGQSLSELLSALQDRNRELGRKPLLVKIAPDLSDSEIASIVDTAMSLEISGIIATNTTVARDGLVTREVESIGSGGVSGKPLTRRANEVISAIYRHSKGKMPIVGVGGIFTAEDTFDKIAAGASLVQAYTGFVYGGPAFARDLSIRMAYILDSKGFSTLDSAIGSGVQ